MSPDQALETQYLQSNHSSFANAIVLDIDHDMAEHAATDAGIPEPHIVTVSRRTGNGHAIWFLDRSIYLHEPSSKRKLTKARSQMCRALGADPGYSGFLTQNPLHEDFYFGSMEIDLYSLKYLDLATSEWKAVEEWTKTLDPSAGRNSRLFAELQIVARRAAYRFDFNRDMMELCVAAHAGLICVDDMLVTGLIQELVDANLIEAEPSTLHMSERNSIARSVIRFAESKYDENYRLQFRKSQGDRRRKADQEAIIAYRMAGFTIAETADVLSLSMSTVKRYLKETPSSEVKRDRNADILDFLMRGGSKAEAARQFNLSRKQVQRIASSI